MIVALIDNGSLEAAPHLNLRAVAAALSERTGVKVHAVSWKHSDRVAVSALDGTPAWTVRAFVREMAALGQREFVFIPFFISPQGAIGSALHADLEQARRESGELNFTFTEGLAQRGALPSIVAARVRATIALQALKKPAVVVVDHGGPSVTSATLRDQVAGEVRRALGPEVGALVAASMEGSHPPLLAHALRAASLAGRDVVVAPLFLSPGRHAGPAGDIAKICAASRARCHLSDLVGTHPRVVDVLAAALQDTLSTLHVQPSA
ncbi:MAG TPA: CbiX/SirB N-terminal domain-containing protein [Opitutaceae bacterium]|nr:CbiX/SirB N-terminal domain-containing protein [Opitutaceae bacterium]